MSKFWKTIAIIAGALLCSSAFLYSRPASIERKLQTIATINNEQLNAPSVTMQRISAIKDNDMGEEVVKYPRNVRIFTNEEIEAFKDPQNKIPQDDTVLIEYIRTNYLRAPSGLPMSFGFGNKSDFSQSNQSGIVDRLLGRRTNGFFVDCGAADGVYSSNTLFFEIQRGWTGLLVEANPGLYKRLVSKRRSAYSINACLSPIPHPNTITFQLANWMGGIPGYFEKIHTKKVSATKGATIQAQCIPLYSILLALDRTHIDYFSLDVEGPEIEILMTIPLDKVRIDVISVEYIVWGGVTDKEATQAKLDRVKTFFNSTGLYNFASIAGPDVIFIRKDMAR